MKPSSRIFTPITDSDLDQIMRMSKIIKDVIRDHEDKYYVVRSALRKRINETGMPFFESSHLYRIICFVTDEEEREEKKRKTKYSNDEVQHSFPSTSMMVKEKDDEKEMRICTTETYHSLLMPGESTTETHHFLLMPGENNKCKICFVRDKNIVFLPCKHAFTCDLCAIKLKNCSICRTVIKYAIKPIYP